MKKTEIKKKCLFLIKYKLSMIQRFDHYFIELNLKPSVARSPFHNVWWILTIENNNFLGQKLGFNLYKSKGL